MKIRIVIATSFITTVIVLIIAISVFALASPSLAQSLPSSHVSDLAPSLTNTHLALPTGGGYKEWVVGGSTFEDIYSGLAEHGMAAGGCRFYLYGVIEGTNAHAPVNLPDGATIKTVRFHFNDESVSNNGMVRLKAYHYDNTTYDILTTLYTSLSPTGAPGFSTVEDTTLNYAFDTVGHFYILEYYAGYIGSDELSLCSVQIGYTVPSVFGSAMPLINK